ncbi:hypothetical protein [Pontibacter diazotrophicus]|nr:hypothetical protein [Pontibacter diazotrophicus]
MLLYRGIITLDYNPATDVLTTSMPDLRNVALSEIGYCLSMIFESIKNYDIKHLLLDCRCSIVEIEDEHYKSIAFEFSKVLMKTRLNRIARVGTADAGREERAAKISEELDQELPLRVVYRSFSSRAEAMDWLLSSVPA